MSHFQAGPAKANARQPANETTRPGAASAAGAKSGVKSQLAGKGFDEQVQMLSPGGASGAVAAAARSVGAGMSWGSGAGATGGTSAEASSTARRNVIRGTPAELRSDPMMPEGYVSSSRPRPQDPTLGHMDPRGPGSSGAGATVTPPDRKDAVKTNQRGFNLTSANASPEAKNPILGKPSRDLNVDLLLAIAQARGKPDIASLLNRFAGKKGIELVAAIADFSADGIEKLREIEGMLRDEAALQKTLGQTSIAADLVARANEIRTEINLREGRKVKVKATSNDGALFPTSGGGGGQPKGGSAPDSGMMKIELGGSPPRYEEVADAKLLRTFEEAAFIGKEGAKLSAADNSTVLGPDQVSGLWSRAGGIGYRYARNGQEVTDKKQIPSSLWHPAFGANDEKNFSHKGDQWIRKSRNGTGKTWPALPADIAAKAKKAWPDLK